MGGWDRSLLRSRRLSGLASLERISVIKAHNLARHHKQPCNGVDVIDCPVRFVSVLTQAARPPVDFRSIPFVSRCRLAAAVGYLDIGKSLKIPQLFQDYLAEFNTWKKEERIVCDSVAGHQRGSHRVLKMIGPEG